jgi:hypothetical protein
VRGRAQDERRRAEAVVRMKAYTYKNSKAFRKGTADEVRWSVRKADEIERLST